VLPLSDDEFFRLELAETIAPMFGGALTPESQNRLTRARARIRARFEVSRDENGAEYF
jgi:PHD/YefM family antitoxin component YafN of YafNO toxin-antitoxin module